MELLALALIQVATSYLIPSLHTAVLYVFFNLRRKIELVICYLNKSDRLDLCYAGSFCFIQLGS